MPFQIPTNHELDHNKYEIIIHVVMDVEYILPSSGPTFE